MSDTNFYYYDMQYTDLITLAETYAAHQRRTLNTVARRAGVHLLLFERLKAGSGCRVDSFNHAVNWLDANWPTDLEWPAGIERPSKKRRAA
jgi:hypothetical protein